MPEWLKGADCKSASVSLRWFESISTHHLKNEQLREPKGSLFVNDYLDGCLNTAFTGRRMCRWQDTTLVQSEGGAA